LEWVEYFQTWGGSGGIRSFYIITVSNPSILKKGDEYVIIMNQRAENLSTVEKNK